MLLLREPAPFRSRLRERLKTGPVRLAGAWLALILVGAVVLRLPVSGQYAALGWVDALFTATSAVCVTGLSTVDVGTHLSHSGQIALLVLIQIGGLGISVISTFLLAAAGKATLSRQYDCQDALAAVRVKPLHLLLWSVPMVILLEGAGALILYGRLDGEGEAGWHGVFHSVSAFCNAGFALYADSVARLRDDGVALATLSVLIALGGLGFITLHQLFFWVVAVVRRRRAALFLHTRVVLLGSAILWLGGAIMFAGFEWSRSMSGLNIGEKLSAATFQSVSTRTAGFSTLDFGQMRIPTLLFTVIFMLIGAAPGSCAGGVKLTTLAVILAAIRARLRGADSVALMQRTIPPEIVFRAFQVVTLAILFLMASIMGLLLVEEGQSWFVHSSDRLAAITFEVASALGTVGLSTGITPHLSTAGKLILILAMYVGRLGPLVVALALVRPTRAVHFEYPKEELAVG